jgi:hypothetical protein
MPRYRYFLHAIDDSEFALYVHSDPAQIAWCVDESKRFANGGDGSLREISRGATVLKIETAKLVTGDSWEIARIKSKAALLNKHGDHARQVFSVIA